MPETILDSSTRLKIAIIGAGALGSAVGALLSRDGQDVTLIGRPAHVEAIRRQGGLRVDGYLGELTVQVKTAESLDFRPDLALLTVKRLQPCAITYPLWATRRW